jgi:general secretion pathway protein L
MGKRAPTSVLQLHLPERWPDALGDPPLRWALRRGADVADGVARLAEIPRAEETVVVVPVARVAFARAALPRGPAARLARLAPFAIEDAIVSAPEQVHCAVLDDGAGGDERLIAVLERDWLASALAELASFGIEPDRAIVESALVAGGEGLWTVVWSGDGGFAALGGLEAIALDASVDGRPPLGLALALDERRRAGSGPRGVRVLVAGAADPPDTAKWTAALQVPVAIAGKWLPEESDARAAACANLLSGARAGGWAADGWLARLKPAAALGAALLAAHVLVTLGDWARLAYEARSLRNAMEAEFRNAFPEAVAVVDPALQMRRNVADLRRAAGEPDVTDLVPLLARLAPALAAADARPQRLRYERGELELDLAVGSGETRERLASRLRVPGMRVRVERIATAGGEPHAKVRVAAEGT